MKFIITTLIILISLSSQSQERGKLVRNQSVKCIVIQIDTMKLFLVSFTNTNSCNSTIEFQYNNNPLDTFSLAKDESQEIFINGDFELKFRNATVCNGGSVDWLYIDNRITALSIQFQVKSNQLNESKLSCEDVIIEPYIPPSDTITKQRMRKTR